MDTYFVILEFHLQAGFEDAVVGTDAHDDDTRTLVVVALTEIRSVHRVAVCTICWVELVGVRSLSSAINRAMTFSLPGI